MSVERGLKDKTKYMSPAWDLAPPLPSARISKCLSAAKGGERARERSGWCIFCCNVNSARVRGGENNFCESGRECTFFFNPNSTGMSHVGVYVIRKVTNVVRNLKR
jgi:hypothetical protein